MASYIKPDNDQLVIESSLNFSDLNAIVSTESALLVKGGAYVNNDLYIGGTLIANGDVITLGNASGSLTLNANISSDILPSTTKTYNIGESANAWNELHVETVIMSPTVETTQATPGASLSAIDGSTNASISLADGTEGQHKIITVSDTLSGNVIVTPDNASEFTSITFAAKGDSASLVFVNGSWNIVSVFRSSVNV